MHGRTAAGKGDTRPLRCDSMLWQSADALWRRLKGRGRSSRPLERVGMTIVGASNVNGCFRNVVCRRRASDVIAEMLMPQIRAAGTTEIRVFEPREPRINESHGRRSLGPSRQSRSGWRDARARRFDPPFPHCQDAGVSSGYACARCSRLFDLRTPLLRATAASGFFPRARRDAIGVQSLAVGHDGDFGACDARRRSFVGPARSQADHGGRFVSLWVCLRSAALSRRVGACCWHFGR